MYKIYSSVRFIKLPRIYVCALWFWALEPIYESWTTNENAEWTPGELWAGTAQCIPTLQSEVRGVRRASEDPGYITELISCYITPISTNLVVYFEAFQNIFSGLVSLVILLIFGNSFQSN